MKKTMNNNKLDFPITFFNGEGSRISNKIIKELKESKDIFNVSKINTPVRLRSSLDQPIEHTIRFKDKSTPNKLSYVLGEIVAMIPDLFPNNYSFRIFRSCRGVPYNYKLEFSIETPYNNELGFILVYTKINEVKKDSRPIKEYDIKIEG